MCERKFTYHTCLEVLRKNSETTPFLVPYISQKCYSTKNLHQFLLCAVSAQGLIVDFKGDPVTNTPHSTEYVLTINNELYINISAEDLHHSDLSLSGSILSAGHISVHSGIVTSFNNRSGHYKASDTRNLFLYCYIIRNKVQISPEYTFDAFIEKLRRCIATAV